MKSQTIPNFIVIDDDPVNNMVCQRIILHAFPRAYIKTFTDPGEGLEYLESTYTQQDPPITVLFLDLNMSTISGWELLKSFEQFDTSLKGYLKIYILSSSVDPLDKVRATSNKNIWNYIRKPLTKQVIKDIVAKVREEEWTFFSRGIRDKLGQQLMRIKMDIVWLSSKIKDPGVEIKEKVSATLALVDETVETTRQIDIELRPQIIDDLGLFAALEWQSKEFSNHTGISCKLRINLPEPELSKLTSINIFRIYQEALSNIEKHALAKEVNTELKYINGNMIMSVQDNGLGFNIKQAKNEGSFGLLRMQERITAINGVIKVQSKPGEGTTIELTVPVILEK